MNIEQNIINRAKLFELDPQLFDRRLITHRRVRLATEEQKKEYPDNLPCSFCGRVGGSCDCDPKYPRKKNRIMTKRAGTHENRREGSTNTPQSHRGKI